jgi:H+/Cl- antiporter ClcA
MRKFYSEQTVMFTSIAKWFVLACIVGILVGVSTTIFLKLLGGAMDVTERHPNYFLLLPIGMMMSDLIIKYLAPDAEGHGTEKVIEAVHKRAGNIDWKVVPVKALTTIITMATGGSVGKEGPAAQIGGGLASGFARFLKLDDDDRKKLVICGISAGFSAVLGTPVAGALFGVEILFAGNLLYPVLLPSLVAGIVSHRVTTTLGVTYFHKPIDFIPEFSQVFFLQVAFFGILIGLCSLIFIEIIGICHSISKSLRMNRSLKALLAGSFLVLLIYLVPGPVFHGMGIDTIKSALAGGHIIWYAFLMKTVFTGVTLGFGGSGGVLIPILFAGAAAGSVFGGVTGMNPGIFAAIGMVGLLSGATNAPIASSILAMEMFGTGIAPYACLAAVISFMMAGHRSVFPSQILAICKSSSIQVQTGLEMKETRCASAKSKTYTRIRKFFRDLSKNRREYNDI